MSSAFSSLVECLSNTSVADDGARSLLDCFQVDNLLKEHGAGLAVDAVDHSAAAHGLVNASPPVYQIDLGLVPLPAKTESSLVSPHAATYHSAHTGRSFWYPTSTTYGGPTFLSIVSHAAIVPGPGSSQR